MDQTYQNDKSLQTAIDALKAAKAIAAPLIDSPSQNEAKRREVADTLTPANSLLELIGKLKALNWLNEADGVTATLASINVLIKTTTEQKTLSWRQINEQLDALLNNINSDQAAIQVRSEKESKKLVEDIDAAVKAIPSAEKFTDADWKQVDGIYVLIQTNTNKASSYPLAPKAPWAAVPEIKNRLQTLDTAVETRSGVIANKLEVVTRQIGLRPQAGRKAGKWAGDHWYFFGLLLVLLIIFKR